MKRAAPGDEGKEAAGDDWMETMPEALRKQMQTMLDMYLGAGIIMTKEKFLAMASQGAEHMS